jgi:hypothetical protein
MKSCATGRRIGGEIGFDPPDRYPSSPENITERINRCHRLHSPNRRAGTICDAQPAWSQQSPQPGL